MPCVKAPAKESGKHKNIVQLRFFMSLFLFPQQLQRTLAIDEQWLGNRVAQDTGIQSI